MMFLFEIMDKYVFQERDEIYESYFLSELMKLHSFLEDKVCIEHVWSTAIKWLWWKWIIDIIIWLSKRHKISYVMHLMELNWYEYREKASKQTRTFFRIDHVCWNKKRRVHLHIVPYWWDDRKSMIGFRDYLKKHSQLVKEYASLKKRWVEIAQWDGDVYKSYKEKFIQDVLSKIV